MRPLISNDRYERSKTTHHIHETNIPILRHALSNPFAASIGSFTYDMRWHEGQQAGPPLYSFTVSITGARRCSGRRGCGLAAKFAEFIVLRIA